MGAGEPAKGPAQETTIGEPNAGLPVPPFPNHVGIVRTIGFPPLELQ